ncbi:TraR/DksA C4-type zinc finger protein [Alkalihalobacillus trypoxylicola]|uniref:Zinc finger DksA/TraR C4-type domain-containing protein n=1 Tax=Alkalihalobacillus trypoxylicola TaxID=519424 RepID=A0A161QB78_9BACI|nr:TraR/DksA C4-type zinc finger protein [Alkalihalobacillus trypoxylicola]KYG35157.1 hypothetical protein AZF04_02130 [Alkalihalobacillus trypoxylicola]
MDPYILRLQKILQKQKEELEKKIQSKQESEHHNSLSAGTGELSQYDNHPADTATDLYEREKDFALEEHSLNEYHEIVDALERIEKGTYGICEKTGQQIPIERLNAAPTARTIVEKSSHTVSNYRPVEEDVLQGFSRYEYDHNDHETQFDAEDAYQAVARFNDNSMTYEDASLDEDDESIGYVEEIEGFLSTGIEGYQGADNVQFQRNVHLAHYFEENEE